jgi:Flp pilus assembly protein TadG
MRRPVRPTAAEVVSILTAAFAAERRRLQGDEGGAVAVVFAIAFSVVFLTAAVAFDFGRLQSDHMRTQNAIDSAALAAAHHMGLPDEQTSGKQTAESYFKANTVNRTGRSLTDENGKLLDTQIDSTKGEVRSRTVSEVTASLMKAIGISTLGHSAKSLVKKGDNTVEIALVLDNSGSMAGQPIIDLRTAAANLVNVVYVGADNAGLNEQVKVAVVPFAGSVNVGAEYRSADWMDRTGTAPTHSENFDATKSRFQLFDAMNVSWGGCVEARPSPHDVSESPPDGTLARQFVPMFAPDEPDSGNSGGKSYTNSYLSDFGGSCPVPPKVCPVGMSTCTSAQKVPQPIAPDLAQKRTCKYAGATANTSAAYGSQKGPNFLCDSRALMRMTTNKQAVLDAISAQQAKGGTNIVEGIMWGWRTLSSAAPFMDGRAYNTPKNTKYLIVMTDGENWHGSLDNQNKSWYHSFGYAVKNRLGTTHTTSALKTQMNNKTLAACTNAKAAGIKVYTVAFRLDADPTTRELLKSCATESANAFVANDGGALISAFEAIGREISKLRVAG